MKSSMKILSMLAALAAICLFSKAFALDNSEAQQNAPHRVTLIVQNHTPPGTEIPILALSDALASQLAGCGFQVVNPYNALGVNQNRDIRGEATPEASAVELAKELGAEGAITAAVIELSDSLSGGRTPTLHQYSVRVSFNLTDSFTGAVIVGETIKRTTKKYTNNQVAQNKTNILTDLLYDAAQECAQLLKTKVAQANWKPGCDRFGEPFATEKYVNEAVAAVMGDLTASSSALEGKIVKLSSELENKLASSDEAKSREIEKLKENAAKDGTNIKALSAKAASLGSENASLAAEIASLKSDSASKANENASLSARIADLDLAAASMANEIASLKSDSASKESEIAALKEELAALKKDFLKLQEMYLADLEAREAESAKKAAEEAARKGVLSLEKFDAAIQNMMAAMRQDANFRQNYDKASKDLNHLPMAIVGVIKDETNGASGNQDLPNFLAAGRVGVRVSLYKSALFEVKEDEERVNLANRIIDSGNSPLEDADLMAALKSHGSPDFYFLGDLRYFPAEKLFRLRLAFHNLWTGKIVWEDTVDMQ